MREDDSGHIKLQSYLIQEELKISEQDSDTRTSEHLWNDAKDENGQSLTLKREGCSCIIRQYFTYRGRGEKG